jgi:hypothetical protein
MKSGGKLENLQDLDRRGNFHGAIYMVNSANWPCSPSTIQADVARQITPVFLLSYKSESCNPPSGFGEKAEILP